MLIYFKLSFVLTILVHSFHSFASRNVESSYNFIKNDVAILIIYIKNLFYEDYFHTDCFNIKLPLETVSRYVTKTILVVNKLDEDNVLLFEK